MSSKSTTKLPGPADRTRESEGTRFREAAKIASGTPIPPLPPLRSGKIFRVDRSPRAGNAERGGLTRTRAHTPSSPSSLSSHPVKYSKSISGYLQRWLSPVCRVTHIDKVYHISDLSLPADSAGGDTFPSRRNGKEGESPSTMETRRAREWKDSFAPRIFTSCRDARPLRDN